MASVPDGDYSHFGWWLRINKTGAYEVDVPSTGRIWRGMLIRRAAP